jgi:hypothetical protein
VCDVWVHTVSHCKEGPLQRLPPLCGARTTRTSEQRARALPCASEFVTRERTPWCDWCDVRAVCAVWESRDCLVGDPPTQSPAYLRCRTPRAIATRDEGQQPNRPACLKGEACHQLFKNTAVLVFLNTWYEVRRHPTCSTRRRTYHLKIRKISQSINQSIKRVNLER